ncbi:hypothetical protein GN958_ATG04638 [Phytophthora infestans]|uniref:RxLR effector PexRD54 WY domain-containing protein n=1 Tax=Phytophthora infestans TaxID=4787 RepID=A0A8S9V0Q1_PHYIN|nr:hypothetical protein GN958_ATG04638 [Phytophthora infestans]
MKRLLYQFGLTSCIAITTIDANASITSSNFQVPNVDNWVPSATTTFLRTSEDEDRAGLSVPAIEKLKTWFTSSNVKQQQLQTWLNEGKSAETVFTRMKLTNLGSFLLYDPQFSVWLKYVDDLNAKTYQKRTPAISILTTQYGDDALYTMFEHATMISRTKDLAKRLQTDQMEHWVAIRKDPAEVFNLFKLDEAGENILSSPKFTAWAKYVDDLNVDNPEDAKFMIPTLRQHYTDVDILQMAESAKSVEGTKTIASRLETEVIKLWLVDRKTPDKAMADLKLGTAGPLLENPLLNILSKYLDVYNAKFPQHKTTMIETFTRKIGDKKKSNLLAAAKSKDVTKDIARNLESAQLKMWLSNGKSIDDVFELLKLYQSEHNFLRNPLLNTWVAYMDAIVHNDPSKTSKLFSTVETKFDDKPLLQILEVAKKFPTLATAAVQMQTEKIRSIFASGMSPEKAFTVLGLDNVGDNLLSNPTFDGLRKCFQQEEPR